MRLVSEPSTIHYLARMSRPFNIKKSIQYPQKQLPCQIPGGSVQYILSKALTHTDLKLRGCSYVSAPDRMLFILGPPPPPLVAELNAPLGNYSELRAEDRKLNRELSSLRIGEALILLTPLPATGRERRHQNKRGRCDQADRILWRGE